MSSKEKQEQRVRFLDRIEDLKIAVENEKNWIASLSVKKGFTNSKRQIRRWEGEIELLEYRLSR